MRYQMYRLYVVWINYKCRSVELLWVSKYDRLIADYLERTWICIILTMNEMEWNTNQSNEPT